MYILDTNAFIEANKKFYGSKFCRGYWEWLHELGSEGKICSIDRVYREMTGGGHEDYVSDWARQNKAIFQSTTGKRLQEDVGQIGEFIKAEKYKPNGMREFMRGADPWLIAKCIEINGIVVTMEHYEPEKRKKVLIPNICERLSVDWMSLWDFMRLPELNANFIYPHGQLRLF